MENNAQKFVALAKELILRIEECDDGEWWFHVSGLFVELEKLRKLAFEELGDWPACQVVTLYRYDTNSAEHPICELREEWDAACFLLTRDPLQEYFSEGLIWANEKNGVSVSLTDDATTRAVTTLRQWIRAVSDGLLSGQESPVLSHRQYLILQALLELGAKSPDTLHSTADIVKRAEGNSADPDQYKEAIADLKHIGFIKTKEGRGGGCWLTAEGKTIAEKL